MLLDSILGPSSKMLFILAALCFSAIQAATVLHHDSPDRVPGQYIVVLHPVVGSAAAKAQQLENAIAQVRAMSGQVGRQWTIESFLGFELLSADDMLASAVGDLPEVRYVQVDMMVYPTACQTVNNPIWNLGRINNRSGVGNYVFENNPSGTSTVFILDTGIRTSHNDFGGRASFGNNFSSSPNGDGNGHGTHCAGTAVGTTHGVAKTLNVIDVKVLPDQGPGTSGGVISGVNWAHGHAASNRVINMSLGGGIDTAMDAAVNSAVSGGSVVVAAAGNSNVDACNVSPARATGAITVGATQQAGDNRWSFSNWGNCVDIFAPGASITSAWWNSDSATHTDSGTSFACPAVAGAIARYLSEVSGASPGGARAWVLNNSTPNVVGDPNGSANRFLFATCPLPT